MANEKVDYTLDPKSFIQGIERMIQSVNKLNDNTSNSLNKMNKSVNENTENQKKQNNQVKKLGSVAKDSLGKAVKSMALMTNVYAMAFAGAKKVISGFMNMIPEVGQTFKVAGQIIGKNFLWPLRKTLMPILQNVLNWVRNNRALFVKLGQVLANMFKGVVTVFKILITTAKNFIFIVLDTFMGKSKNIVKSFEKFVNMLVFRITTLATFVSLLLESFFKGFAKGMPKLKTAFDSLIKSVKDLLALVFGGDENLADFAELIGEVLVNGLTLAVEAVAKLVEGISNLSKGLKDLVGKATAPTEQRVKEKRIKTIQKENNIGWNEALEIYKQEEAMKAKAKKRNMKIDDAIIKPDGTVIKTNPMDTLVALKNVSGAVNKDNGGASLNMGNIVLNVTANTNDPQQLGEQLATTIQESLDKKLRNMLSNQAVLAGGY